MSSKESDEAEQVKDLIEGSRKLRDDSERLAKTQQELVVILKRATAM